MTHKGIDCRIVIGVTPGFEEEAERLRYLIRDAEAPIMISVDIPHDPARTAEPTNPAGTW